MTSGSPQEKALRESIIVAASQQLRAASERDVERAISRAERQQELHDWVHGRIDHLPEHDGFDRNLMRAWGVDPDKPWAEQDDDAAGND